MPKSVFPTVAVRLKNVYGETKLYPANTQAELLAKLAGTVTLTRRALELAEQMGFVVQMVSDAQDWKAVA